jgi:hypothetical protein
MLIALTAHRKDHQEKTLWIMMVQGRTRSPEGQGKA